MVMSEDFSQIVDGVLFLYTLWFWDLYFGICISSILGIPKKHG